MGDPSPHVCLLGASLGTGNRGVSALGASLVHLMNEALPSTQPIMLVAHRDSGPFEAIVNGARRPVMVINHRLSPKAPLEAQILWIGLLSAVYRVIPWAPVRRWIRSSNAWLRAVVEARLVGEICGGDSFSDIYGLKRFLLRSLPTVLVVLIRRDIVLFPQTYGPFKTVIARRVASWIMRRASAVLARDQVSVSVARDLGARPECVRFCPDVAFTLPLERPSHPAIEPRLDSVGGSCLIGFNVSGLLYHGGYSRSNMFDLVMDYQSFVRRLVPLLLKSEGNHVLLVPHTFAPVDRVESDNGACLDLQRSLPPDLSRRVHLVTKDYDQHQIKGVIGLCDFFIGSRMHACIAALSQGIPTVGVAYSRKFSGVFESVGMGEWVIDGKDTPTDKAIDRVTLLFQQRGAVREGLTAAVQAAKKAVTDNFAALAAQPIS